MESRPPETPMTILGMPDDFIGHAGGDNFVVITSDGAAPQIQQMLKDRFNKEVLSHYNFMDRDRGFIEVKDENGGSEKAPMMTLELGMVSPTTHMFSDIREITELAAEERRKNAGV